MTGRLHGLDALRGIAALLVLGTHIDLFTGDLPLLSHAYLAVDFFFMLSGYVMARTYEAKMQGGLSPAAFVWKRVWRLWPLIALGTLIGFLFRPNPVLLVWGLLLVPAVTRLAFPLNGPAWSIFFELIANLAHAFGLRRLSRTGLLATAGLSGAVCVLAAYLHDGLNVGSVPGDLLWGFPRVVFAYCLGIWLYRTWQDGPPFKLPPLATIAAMPIAIITLRFAPWWADLLFVAFCPVLIAGGLSMRGNGFLTYLGAMSFPLYATHIPVMKLAVSYGLNPWVAAGAALMLAALLAFDFRRLVTNYPTTSIANHDSAATSVIEVSDSVSSVTMK